MSDRDTVFLSEFWQELFKLQGCALHTSTTYHPQSDGQTEVVNRCVETYLRCMTGDKPFMWVKFSPLAEYWYNTNFHTATQMTPYEIVYGQTPPVHLPYLPGESKIQVVAKCLEERENTLLILNFHLTRAQLRMKQHADKHRSERTFEIGDWVYVKLQPYKQQSVVTCANQKIAPKYFGPYKVLDRHGTVAYRLELPETSQIHPVFPVSQLKKSVGVSTVSTQLPSVVFEEEQRKPEYCLGHKMVKRGDRAAMMVLVKWHRQVEDEATWEFLFDMQ